MLQDNPHANAWIVAEKMVCDGARFSLPHMGDDLYFQNKARVERLCLEAGMTEQEFKAAVKTDVISAGKGAGRRLIDVWWCNGKAAEIIGRALEQFSRNTSEMHVKCFWVEAFDGAHDQFIDALWASKFAITMAGFRGKPRAQGRRTSGHKGARIGNPTSDNHKVIYKGRGERTGMESHIKGRQLSRIKQTADERHRSEKKRVPTTRHWDVLVDEVRYYAAATLLKSLREAGINVCEFFKGVSSISWLRPLGPDDAEALDSEQEAWYVSTATARLRRQLDLFEGE